MTRTLENSLQELFSSSAGCNLFKNFIKIDGNSARIFVKEKGNTLGEPFRAGDEIKVQLNEVGHLEISEAVRIS